MRKSTERDRKGRREYYLANTERVLVLGRLWKDANRDRCSLYRKRYRAKVRKAVLALLGDVCARCGFSDERALQIDHVQGASEDKQSYSRSGHGLCLKVLRGEIDRSLVQLLCANCNWIKRAENDECQGPRNPPPGERKSRVLPEVKIGNGAQ